MTDGRVDAYASIAHYESHLRPIIDALPESIRGSIYADGRNVAREMRGPAIAGTPPRGRIPVLVAGFQDLARTARPVVLVQHGAGQTYSGCVSPSAAGGPNHEAAALHIVPSQRVADLETARYPTARVAVVGVPKLDGWAQVPKPRNDPPVVAVTFHWPQYLHTVDDKPVPEAGWAWPTWHPIIERAVADKRIKILGHAHPRARQNLVNWYAMMGVEFVADAEDLLARADCLLLDNSSLGAEWAALDRPTVWLRGEDWSDTVHGFPRFGSFLPGPELGTWVLRRPDPVGELVDAVRASIERFTLARAAFRQEVYDGLVDGYASRRAAAAVMDLIAAPNAVVA